MKLVRNILAHVAVSIPMLAFGAGGLYYTVTSSNPGKDWPGLVFFGIFFFGPLYILLGDAYHSLMWHRHPAAARRWFREYGMSTQQRGPDKGSEET